MNIPVIRRLIGVVGAVALLVAVTPDLIDKIKAGDIIKEIAPIVGGTGGGRPDLAGSWLRHVLAPTLLIVGERDEPVIHMNEQAMAQMHAEVRLEIVLGATHLFEEPGALERVAALAGQWFETHLHQ